MPVTDMSVIPHRLHNPSARETILLVHGGFSSAKKWHGVVSILTDAGYHLLIPDLPGHGDSVHIQPFEVEDTARRLVLLIETEAREGAAHVASISIGLRVAACLAAQYPLRVRSLVASGFQSFYLGYMDSIYPAIGRPCAAR